MVYTVSTKNYLGNSRTIVKTDENGHEIPVLNIFQTDMDFPGDMDKLAANVASLLNGNEPLYKINIGSNKMFWQRHDKGASLRLQEVEQ